VATQKLSPGSSAFVRVLTVPGRNRPELEKTCLVCPISSHLSPGFQRGPRTLRRARLQRPPSAHTLRFPDSRALSQLGTRGTFPPQGRSVYDGKAYECSSSVPDGVNVAGRLGTVSVHAYCAIDHRPRPSALPRTLPCSQPKVVFPQDVHFFCSSPDPGPTRGFGPGTNLTPRT